LMAMISIRFSEVIKRRGIFQTEQWISHSE
jgi:hypothetical protein